MNKDRFNCLMRDDKATLTLDELRDGWHWCDEFDGLLMQNCPHCTTAKDLMIRAEEIARQAHRNQKRWDGSPYIQHPEAVAAMGKTAREVIIGWLHDVVEDCPEWTLDILRKEFSDEVIKAIDYITKKPGQTYANFIKQVSKNELATRVKIYDLTHNLSNLSGQEHKHRRDKYELAKLYLEQNL